MLNILGRTANEARNYVEYTAYPRKKKFATAHSAAKLFIFPPCFAAQHGHYTSNLLPSPMSGTDNMYRRRK